MQRREFIAGLGAARCPLAPRALQPAGRGGANIVACGGGYILLCNAARRLTAFAVVLLSLVAGVSMGVAQTPAAGTWTALNNPPGVNLMSPRLLTDGTVVAMTSCTSNWYKLTPDINGSYINGTWSQIASTVAGYAPRFFASGVLPDGRLIIEGGEYYDAGCFGPPQIPDATQGSSTTQGAIYDPVANTWTPVSPPSGWNFIGNSAGAVLNGTYHQTDCCDIPAEMAFFNASTLTWTSESAVPTNAPWGAQSIGLPQSGPEMLTVENGCPNASTFQTRTAGVWSVATTIINFFGADCYGNNAGHSTNQQGPLVGLPNGDFVAFGGWTGNPGGLIYSIYSGGMWSPTAVMPTVGGVGYTMTAAPAVTLPSGNVLLAMSPGNWQSGGLYPPPTHFWEFNPSGTSFTLVGDKSDAANFNAYQQNLLLLPNGQVLATTIDGPTVEIYTPLSSTYQSSWQPTVSSVPSCVAPGATYSLTGTRLTGLDDGGFGKTVGAQTNYPLVQIVMNATGHVFYARATGSSASGTNFQVASNTESGIGALYVVANGIPSAGSAITVTSDCASLKTATHDFNGDGMSDVLWHDTSGNVAIWEMNGTSILNLATSFVGQVPTAWSIVGTGDFNGDGKSDVLWHDTSGNFAIWEMNGTSILNLATSFVANVPTAWSIVGSGDFNGDGKSDIVWYNSGNVAILEMNGTTILNQATSSVGQAPTVWSIQDPQGN